MANNPDFTEQLGQPVAGNGLLDRRFFLKGSAAIAAAAGAANAAHAESIGSLSPPSMLKPGAGFTADIAVRSNDNGTLQALVGAGVGAALVPRLVFDRQGDGIVAVELGDRVPPRVLVLAWHPGRRLLEAVDEFVAAVSRAVGTLAVPNASTADRSHAEP